MFHQRQWFVALILLASVWVFAGVLLIACGDDDDDDAVSYGEDIEGLYNVHVATMVNTCPDGELPEEDWILTIEQSGDLATAEVLWQLEGAGSEPNSLFKGEVFGTLVVRNDVEKNTLDEDCIQLKIVYYRLVVDPDTAAVSGWLIDDIVYVGDNCSPSTVDCRTERSVEPSDAGDDDTDTDDDTI